jgi:hypothetical protein
MIRKPVQVKLAPNSHQRCGRLELTYLSLNPVPAADFPLTEMMASSNPHDEAAWATPDPRTSSDGTREWKKRIVADSVL